MTRKHPVVSLDDCVDLLAGFAFKSQYFTNKGEDIPLVKGENVSQGHILWGISKRWPVSEWESLAKYQLRAGDVVVAMDRPWVPAGLKWAYIRGDHPKALLVQRCARLRSKSSNLDQDFLRFVIGGQGFENYVKPITTGVNIPHISGKQILDYKFPLPPLPIQQRIAGILSAYDELIENSQRRIKILEAMARGLYREWFVHFRFPGHENHPRVASALGEIPQGWEVKRLSTVSEVNRAQINARSAPDELHYIDISSVSPGQIDSTTTYTFADAPGRARRIIQHGDVLWSCVRPNRRSHAQVMHPEQDTIASTGFAVLTATQVPFTFLYFATTTDDFVAFLSNNATGAAYPAVSGSTFEKADLLIPTASLLKKFGTATIPMAEQIHTLQTKIQNLRRTRDLLLPRLLSGQINVEAP
ncbi:MAG: restriction endonuclease subunit S [Rhodoferax sp.]|nr:restriction endonuclease subunit S [Rhodoferax sp.]